MNGGEFYGTPEHNSLTFLKKCYEKYLEDADELALNIKGCYHAWPITRWPSDFVEKSVLKCVEMLGVKGRIDMFECVVEIPMFHSKKHWEPWQSW